MTQCTSVATMNRVWGNLVNKETGTTLQLDPSESADVGIWVEPTEEDGSPVLNGTPTVEDLPADFDYETAFLAPPTPTPTRPPVQSSSPPAGPPDPPTPATSAADPQE